jgi:hypothetical protein
VLWSSPINIPPNEYLVSLHIATTPECPNTGLITGLNEFDLRIVDTYLWNEFNAIMFLFLIIK